MKKRRHGEIYTGCVWMGSKNGGERAGRKGGGERGLLAGGGAGYTCDKGKYEGL